VTHGGTATPSKIDKCYKTEGVTHEEIAKLTVTDLHVPAGMLAIAYGALSWQH